MILAHTYPENDHTEHHIYLYAPTFNHLPALHRHPIQNPNYVREIDIRRGYMRFLLIGVWLNEQPIPAVGI